MLRRLLVSLTSYFIAVLLCSSSLGQESENKAVNGVLSITVSVGETHTPFGGAFVFVRGHRRWPDGEWSDALTPTKDGYFQLILSPGLYDVFVSRGSTFPSCKRFAITAGHAEHYDANLKIDEEHMEK
jgi:hypothetical protein